MEATKRWEHKWQCYRILSVKECCLDKWRRGVWLIIYLVLDLGYDIWKLRILFLGYSLWRVRRDLSVSLPLCFYFITEGKSSQWWQVHKGSTGQWQPQPSLAQLLLQAILGHAAEVKCGIYMVRKKTSRMQKWHPVAPWWLLLFYSTRV